MNLDSWVESFIEYSLNERLWFPKRSLNVVLVRPMYCIGDGSDGDVTVALYTIFLAWQLPSKGQLGLSFRGQLQDLPGSAGWVVLVLLGSYHLRDS